MKKPTELEKAIVRNSAARHRSVALNNADAGNQAHWRDFDNQSGGGSGKI